MTIPNTRTTFSDDLSRVYDDAGIRHPPKSIINQQTGALRRTGGSSKRLEILRSLEGQGATHAATE